MGSSGPEFRPADLDTLGRQKGLELLEPPGRVAYLAGGEAAVEAERLVKPYSGRKTIGLVLVFAPLAVRRNRAIDR